MVVAGSGKSGRWWGEWQVVRRVAGGGEGGRWW